MKERTKTPRRIKTHNPAGTKLIKRFIKNSNREYPEYVEDLKRLAPRDSLLNRYNVQQLGRIAQRREA